MSSVLNAAADKRMREDLTFYKKNKKKQIAFV